MLCRHPNTSSAYGLCASADVSPSLERLVSGVSKMRLKMCPWLLFVAVMATAIVQEAPHEYLGIGLFVAVVAHVALNRVSGNSMRWHR